jgi:toxin ParE1/3/4
LYKLEYLPVARKDMLEIVRYISRELQNPDAADSNEMDLNEAKQGTESIRGVLLFPYATPTYQPIRPLKHEYRKILVQNYLMFYWVDEEKKLVTVARVVYAKRDYGRLLE